MKPTSDLVYEFGNAVKSESVSCLDDFSKVSINLTETDIKLPPGYMEKHPDGLTTVVVHSDGTSFFVNGVPKTLDEVASLLPQSNSPILLLSCADLEAAKKLSAKLGRTVYTNDGRTFVHSDGGITTLNKEGTASAKWYEIKPDGTQVEYAFKEETTVPEEFVELGWFGTKKKPEEIKTAETVGEEQKISEEVLEELRLVRNRPTAILERLKVELAKDIDLSDLTEKAFNRILGIYEQNKIIVVRGVPTEPASVGDGLKARSTIKEVPSERSKDTYSAFYDVVVKHVKRQPEDDPLLGTTLNNVFSTGLSAKFATSNYSNTGYIYFIKYNPERNPIYVNDYLMGNNNYQWEKEFAYIHIIPKEDIIGAIKVINRNNTYNYIGDFIELQP